MVINMSAVRPAGVGLPDRVRRRSLATGHVVGELLQKGSNARIWSSSRSGSDGKIAVYNGSGGGVDLVGDVEGYYRSGSATQPGTFTQSPAFRLYDSRSHSPLGSNTAVPVAVAGRDGVPTTGGVTALVNIVATQYSGNGRIETYGSERRRAEHDLVELPARNRRDGRAGIRAGRVQRQHRAAQRRHRDDRRRRRPRRVRARRDPGPERHLAPAGPKAIVADAFLAARATRAVHVLGGARVPSTGVGAVLLDASSVGPAAGGYLTVWPAGVPRPATSTALWEGTIPTTDLVLAKVGTGGNVEI